MQKTIWIILAILLISGAAIGSYFFGFNQGIKSSKSKGDILINTNTSQELLTQPLPDGLTKRYEINGKITSIEGSLLTVEFSSPLNNALKTQRVKVSSETMIRNYEYKNGKTDIVEFSSLKVGDNILVLSTDDFLKTAEVNATEIVLPPKIQE